MSDDLLSSSGPDDYNADSIEVLEGLEPVRKRPGMYIGGTDERALHHLVAEVLDNSMDEAVAGHANRIEVELHADYSVTIKDNGRGIPVDPHPKFPDKSALEVILCTLHAGGKFSGKAYQTSGGLHGVGASVVNALSDSLVVQVARNKELYEQRFSRGIPLGPVEKIGSAPNRRGTTFTFHADPEIFGSHRFKPARMFNSMPTCSQALKSAGKPKSTTVKPRKRPRSTFPAACPITSKKRLAPPRPTPTNRSQAPSRSMKSSMNRAKSNGRLTGRLCATGLSNPTVTPCPPPKAARMSAAFGPRS